MIFLGLIMVGVLIWAVKSGQYDDLEGDAQRLLMDEDEPSKKQGRKKRRKAPAKDAGKNWPDAED